MDYWVSTLRDQVRQMISGDYRSGTPAFSRAPFGMAELSLDLDNLAQVMAKREAARMALAHEVHHRVKNNLQIITSLLEMQASRIANPAVGEALGQTRARIGALALIHRILYEHDDSGNQATLAGARLLTELCAQLREGSRNRKGISFTCKADALAIPLDSALPLALFAVEAVTNAFAYAFPNGGGGKIELQFSVNPEDETATLRVTDNGVGFDSKASGNSMGRQLMHGFARQLGGTFAISSSAEAGTEVRLDYCPEALLPLDPA